MTKLVLKGGALLIGIGIAFGGYTYSSQNTNQPVVSADTMTTPPISKHDVYGHKLLSLGADRKFFGQ